MKNEEPNKNDKGKGKLNPGDYNPYAYPIDDFSSSEDEQQLFEKKDFFDFQAERKKRDEGQGSSRDFSQTTPNRVPTKRSVKEQISPSKKEEILKVILEEPSQVLR